MKSLQCMRKNKLNLYLDIKTLLLLFRVSFNLGVPFQEAVISGSGMAKPQFAFSTKPLSVTSVCFSTGDTKYIYPDENS